MAIDGSAHPGPTQSYERTLLIIEAVVGVGVVAFLIRSAYGAFSTFTFLLCAVAMAFTVWVIVRMLTSLTDPTLQVTGKVRDYRREKLEGEKRLILQGIKDLEADYATSKMDEREYNSLRGSAEARAVEIIRELKQTDEHWALEAQKLVSARTGIPVPQPKSSPKSTDTPPAPDVRQDVPAADSRVFLDTPVAFTRHKKKLKCEACGYHNDTDARFCSGCGRPRQMEAA